MQINKNSLHNLTVSTQKNWNQNKTTHFTELAETLKKFLQIYWISN